MPNRIENRIENLIGNLIGRLKRKPKQIGTSYEYIIIDVGKRRVIELGSGDLLFVE